VPIPQTGTGTSTTITIEFKEFGVRLSFLPVVLGNGRIRMKVAPEVSQLDFTNAVSLSGFRVPGLTTRKLATHRRNERRSDLRACGIAQQHRDRDERRDSAARRPADPRLAVPLRALSAR
jgi:pilus assembly protein CpaC